MAIGTEGLGRSRARGGPAAPAASQDREEPALGERSTRRDRDHPDRPTLSWATVGRGVPVCEGARFHGVHKRSRCSQVVPLLCGLGWGGRLWGQGLESESPVGQRRDAPHSYYLVIDACPMAALNSDNSVCGGSVSRIFPRWIYADKPLRNCRSPIMGFRGSRVQI